MFSYVSVFLLLFCAKGIAADMAESGTIPEILNLDRNGREIELYLVLLNHSHSHNDGDLFDGARISRKSFIHAMRLPYRPEGSRADDLWAIITDKATYGAEGGWANKFRLFAIVAKGNGVILFTYVPCFPTNNVITTDGEGKTSYYYGLSSAGRQKMIDMCISIMEATPGVCTYAELYP